MSTPSAVPAPTVDYRALLESVHAIVWRADARTFQTTFASQEAEDILGYPVASWTDMPGFWASHIHADDRTRVLEFTSAETRAGRFHDFEYRMIAADGRVVWLRNIVNVISRGGEPVELVGVTVDITARKRSEIEAEQLRQELIRVARAASVGELAAALAHEVNQPLGAIVANAETLQRMLRRGVPPIDRLAAIVDDIRADAQRAGDIIHRIKASVERQPVKRVRLHIASLVDGVIKMLRTLLTTRRIDCTVDIPRSLAAAAGDPVQIQQVLVNLIRNAIDAIVERDPPERAIAIRAQPRGPDCIELSVSDTGQGIAPDILPRLFQPFVTSKNGGIGMGLPVCKRIVESHGGRIQAANTDRGATISFTLPIDDRVGGAA